VLILGKKSLKIFSRSRKLIAIKLDTNHPSMKGIQVRSNKGHVLIKRELITEMQK
jgi:hypothetical protein